MMEYGLGRVKYQKSLFQNVLPSIFFQYALHVDEKRDYNFNSCHKLNEKEEKEDEEEVDGKVVAVVVVGGGERGGEKEEKRGEKKIKITKKHNLLYMGGDLHCLRGAFKSNGFHKLVSGKSWNVFWGKHLKPHQIENLDLYQKINHFPARFI